MFACVRLHLIRPRFAGRLSRCGAASLPLRERLEERANQGLPLEGKLSAARLTDEVANTRLCCVFLGMRKQNRAETTL